MKKRSHFPAFGSWDYCHEHSFTQYLESAMPGAGEDADRHHPHHLIKKGQQKKQGKVCDVVRAQATPRRRSSRARKAVDEDLYQIPPELLCKTPKRQKGLLRMMLSGLNCICIA